MSLFSDLRSPRMAGRFMLFLSLCFVFSACSSVSPFIDVPAVTVAGTAGAGGRQYVLVESVLDERLSMEVVRSDDADEVRRFKVDLDSALRPTIIKALATKGIVADDTASSLRLQIAVREWQVFLEDGFSKTASASAALAADVYNAEGKKIFHGEYTARSQVKHPFLDDEDNSKALSLAMEESLRRLVADHKLVAVLGQ
ncbi:MAG: YajG family lipoprotein [bacterium]|nr:YajG family lipoprotein [bacterium]